MIVKKESNILPAEREGLRNNQFGTLAGLSTLYIGFGMTMGVIQGGFPTVMRAQGMSMGSAGWLYALYLSFGLSFLWASWIDRLRPPVLTPRIGWIVLMQLVAVTAVLSVAFLESAPLALLFALGFFVASAVGTMDIALDALAVELVAPSWRPNTAAAKLAALSTGAMIGSGAFIVLFSTFGWRVSFLLLAAGLALLLLPVLTLVCVVIFPLSALNRLMLLDLGVPVATIGWVVGTLGPLAMLVTSFVSMPLMTRLGLPSAIIAFTALGLTALASLAAGSMLGAPVIAITGAVLIGAAVSGIYVAVTAKILGWAAGAQPATDYAAYYGVSRLASTVVTIIAAQVIPDLGWPLFYGLGAFALIVAVSLLHGPISQGDQNG
ncbi:MFS transporter [Agrobacterium tumefaciens]|uniref:MFS transporter n=1 Tax=Agrobacterium tumefaciens TaxID=358 RepID=UPI0011786446